MWSRRSSPVVGIFGPRRQSRTTLYALAGSRLFAAGPAGIYNRLATVIPWVEFDALFVMAFLVLASQPAEDADSRLSSLLVLSDFVRLVARWWVMARLTLASSRICVGSFLLPVRSGDDLLDPGLLPA